MARFISGPLGSYNIAKLVSIHTRGSHGDWKYFARLDNGDSVEIYSGEYSELEATRGTIVPGNGVCKFVWFPHDLRDYEEYPGIYWQTSTIIAWDVSAGDEWHKPICIDQPSETCFIVVQDGDRWVCIGDRSFNTWDDVEKEAQRRLDDKVAAFRQRAEEKKATES